MPELEDDLNPNRHLHRPHWGINILMSIIVCAAWGYLLYMGTLDILWRMLGIANQLLATIALAVGTTYLAVACAEAALRTVHGHSVRVHPGHDRYRQRDEHSRLVGRTTFPPRSSQTPRIKCFC